MRRIALAAALLALWSGTAAAQGALTVTSGSVTTDYTRHLVLVAIPRGNASTQPTADGVGSVACSKFANTGSKYSYVEWEVPNDAKSGADVTFEVDWIPFSGNMSGTDTVKFLVEYGSRSPGEAVNGSLTTVPISTDADITRYVTTHSGGTIDYDDATNALHHEDHVFFRITRDNTVANNWTGDVCVTAFEIIYTSNSFPEGM